MQTMWTTRTQTEVLPQLQHLLGCVPEEHIENVPPAESHKTNVVNTDDMDDVSPQHSIRTFSGLRNLLTRHSGFKIGCFNIRGLLNRIDEMITIVTECNFDIMGIESSGCKTELQEY